MDSRLDRNMGENGRWDEGRKKSGVEFGSLKGMYDMICIRKAELGFGLFFINAGELPCTNMYILCR